MFGRLLSYRIISMARVVALASLFGPSARAMDAIQNSRAEARDALARVERWGCQYLNVDPHRVAGSNLDLIVLDPILDGGRARTAGLDDIRAMQRKPDGGRRLVVAYLSVGAAEEYRPYWKSQWRRDPPPWLGSADPVWSRSHSVRYWHPDWQKIVTDSLHRIVEAGFDGVFLDRVDAYHWWRGEHVAAQEDMADFVVRLGQAARARQPGFILIGQNAEHLLMFKRYRLAIDAVSKESLLTGMQGEGVPNQTEQSAWSVKHLEVAKGAGLTIFAIEYLQGRPEMDEVSSRLRSMGFVPFIGTRLLDRLPGP